MKKPTDDAFLVLEELTTAQKVLHDFIQIPHIAERMVSIAQVMAQSLIDGHKILSCGNGGSHADAIHFAQELTGRFREDRAPLAALAISDAAHLTCTANDYGFEEVFARYIQGVGQPGDVLLALSTSGNSPNIIRAIEEAKRKHLVTILLSGKDGGKLAGIADHEIIVPYHKSSDRIQEVHIKIIHIFIRLIERYTTKGR